MQDVMPHRLKTRVNSSCVTCCDALCGLKFGTVTIIVQDGVVVQIDRTEKRRLARGKTSQ